MTKRQQPPSDLADKFMLRLPDGMRDRIREAAKRNGRSMNSEIVATLEDAYPDDGIAFEAFLSIVKDRMSSLNARKKALSKDFLNPEKAAKIAQIQEEIDRILKLLRDFVVIKIPEIEDE